jgi:hypothetical protein
MFTPITAPVFQPIPAPVTPTTSPSEPPVQNANYEYQNQSGDGGFVLRRPPAFEEGF